MKMEKDDLVASNSTLERILKNGRASFFTEEGIFVVQRNKSNIFDGKKMDILSGKGWVLYKQDVQLAWSSSFRKIIKIMNAIA